MPRKRPGRPGRWSRRAEARSNRDAAPSPYFGARCVLSGVIEVIVSVDQDVSGAGISGVGMKNLAGRPAVEYAETGKSFAAVVSSRPS
jgi:hypothetical protein